MKKIVLSLVVFSLVGCAEMQQVLDQLPQGTGVLSQAEIGNGLKEALNNGITKQVSKLTATDGFFKMKPLKFYYLKNYKWLIKSYAKLDCRV